ncbi:DUF5723 family protein [Mucilaginibacter phyllosphaerae]|uniref:DUF5723 domain-containing protein n=1 Tax=Mucilaginibacter phyllosphaerae TaxID=1812349 RepID=A0A4Y8A6U0_9SPHI|nr:DUF5723 family protein [Mucilaginibacter phyllosphaerae]MBB3970994.1 hypothetical protein [Mucilaginibacter phyllosphaerae]TEW64075.1 hypothetical protein E2R65_17150 [Mucilaginibacter phyllosphaerae]GGH05929.1 hypothetical protein GCM10007352_09940 [Mucilaginibacter phyllosphaerae]
MKYFLLAICFLFISVETFGQQFSQYNTGTLYDSFENPGQSTFKPDTSYNLAFNFFVPNFNSNVYLTGNGQVPLKSRAFAGKYLNTNLVLGNNRFSRANIEANIYSLMFKVYTSLDGDQEIGISTQTRAEGRGLFSDETLLLLTGFDKFTGDVYDNILNNQYTEQTYHQVSFSYREKVNKQFAIGFKLSALLGIQYQKLQIDQSRIEFDKLNDLANISLQGRYRISFTPGEFSGRDLLPTLRNPGASISIGTVYRTRDNFTIQANVKDLGFIHWYKRSKTSNFNTTRTALDLNTNRREDNLYAAAYGIIRSADTEGAFVTPTNGKAEVSANRSYWFDYDRTIKYSPTIVLQKELFYEGYTAAIVNPVQYNNLVGTLTSSYNNYGIFTTGLQFMVKAPNVEFYMGTDRLIQTANLFSSAGKSNAAINKSASYSGADFFLGFSLKFGRLIEHPLNGSRIPLGERPGFLKRIWDNIFHPGRDDGS